MVMTKSGLELRVNEDPAAVHASQPENTRQPEEVTFTQSSWRVDVATEGGVEDEMRGVGSRVMGLVEREAPAPKQALGVPEKDEKVLAACEILGADNVFGPEAVRATWGVELANVPAIPFSTEQLQRAKEMNMMLVLRVDMNEKGSPLSLEEMNHKTKEKRAGQDGELLFSDDQYGVYNNWRRRIGKEEFKQTPPQGGWALVGRDFLADSAGKNYLEQTRVIVDFLRNKWFKGGEVSAPYQEAIAEFETMDAEIKILNKMVEGSEDDLGAVLSRLKINQLVRPSVQEVVYDLAMNRDRGQLDDLVLACEKMASTCSVSQRGQVLSVGRFSRQGIVADERKSTRNISWEGAVLSLRS